MAAHALCWGSPLGQGGKRGPEGVPCWWGLQKPRGASPSICRRPGCLVPSAPAGFGGSGCPGSGVMGAAYTWCPSSLSIRAPRSLGQLLLCQQREAAPSPLGFPLGPRTDAASCPFAAAKKQLVLKTGKKKKKKKECCRCCCACPASQLLLGLHWRQRRGLQHAQRGAAVNESRFVQSRVCAR